MNDNADQTEREDPAADPDIFESEETDEEPRPRKRRGVAIAVSVAVVMIAAAAGVAIVAGLNNDKGAAAEKPTVALTTAAVTKGDVTVETQAQGTLEYAGQRPVSSGLTGVVTSLPAVGSLIGTGGTLYTVNTAPVVLMSGAMPAWRDFTTGMSKGEDVRQLETNLAAFGVFSGDVDTEFTAKTADAIRKLQKSQGVEQTGTLSSKAVMFSTEDLRVAELKTTVGASVSEGTEIFQASANSKVVTVNLKLSDQALAVPGAAVTVGLPTGTETAGAVASVGVPTEQAGADESAAKTVVLPVVITLADQAATGDLQRATVSVRFSSAQSGDLLTVPVEALVAIDDSSFAVEVPGKGKEGASKRVPVTTGIFASGRVAITGDGIAEGVKVMVPKR
jgi:peptidoglycan hydrolase-like protein with peptidoglycan-binding domain